MELVGRLETNINDTFFQSAFKEVWRKMIPGGLTEAEADFIQEVGKLTPGDTVLDIMCGYGRHSIELAKRGYNLTAIDNLSDYIEEIQSTSKREHLSIVSKQEDVALMDINGNFNAIICMGNSFCFFERQMVKKILKSLFQSLESGGVFILNNLSTETAITHFEAKTWLYVQEFTYLMDNKYYLAPTRIETDHTLITKDGQIQVLKGIDYLFSFSEWKDLLEEAGFHSMEVYSTPRKRKYQVGDKSSYIVCSRN